MSEIIKQRVKESIGKEVKIFLINNFRYVGKITNADEKYIEIFDTRSNSYKLILYEEIKDIGIKK